MSLFNRLKGKPSSSTANTNEFEQDIRELLARDDIQCKEDVCEAEYAKAQSLLKKIDKRSLQKAYDIMSNLASQFEYIPAFIWMGDYAESVSKELQQAAFWYKRAADMGDGNGARCYADMLMTGNGVEKDIQQAIQYYSYAADKGIPEASFVLGEFLRTNGDRENAVKAYQHAAENGYFPAITRINQMKNGQI